ncbi:MAG: FtsH protease activity modulator HflK [Betaproteobacteria bacterium]|nr:FtsH protease activity modulator HflK [Betaproteobacteria bacterium]
MSPNDPHWGNRDNNGNGGRGGRRGDEQGPPDLEEIWQDFNKRLSGIFGRRREGGPIGPGGGGGRPTLPSFKQFGGGLGMLVLIVLVIWLGSGFYTVDTNERGVVLRLGKYRTVTDPGLNWRLPRPFETHEIVDLTGLRTVSVGSQGNARALMLTDDQNIVAVQFAVQYVLKTERDEFNNERGPRDFIFENRDPNEEFVRQIAETAMREIVGKSKMDFVLYEGREQIAASTQKLIQDILDRYKSGIQVSRVTMEEVQPPEQVQAAFDDATRATQDQERKKNEGEAYANNVIPAAQGTASRLRAESEAYRASVIAKAEGETARFKQVFSEFKRAPQVTRERMYLDAVQDVLSSTSKVMIDNKGSSNLLYLPLDKLVQQPSSGRASAAGNAASEPAQPSSPPSSTPPASPQSGLRDRDFMRDRNRGDL